jgi:hypothetical protein
MCSQSLFYDELCFTNIDVPLRPFACFLFMGDLLCISGVGVCGCYACFGIVRLSVRLLNFGAWPDAVVEIRDLDVIVGIAENKQLLASSFFIMMSLFQMCKITNPFWLTRLQWNVPPTWRAR